MGRFTGTVSPGSRPHPYRPHASHLSSQTGQRCESETWSSVRYGIRLKDWNHLIRVKYKRRVSILILLFDDKKWISAFQKFSGSVLTRKQWALEIGVGRHKIAQIQFFHRAGAGIFSGIHTFFKRIHMPSPAVKVLVSRF